MPNCTVPCLHMRLGLTHGQPTEYVATFTEGPCKGKEIRALLSSIDENKWQTCLIQGARWQSTGVAVKDASWDEKCRALSYYLERHCAILLLKALDHDSSCDPLATDDPLAALCVATVAT